MKITTMGIDLAKEVFQIHGMDERGKIAVRKQMRHKDMAEYFANLGPCLIGMEARGGTCPECQYRFVTDLPRL